MRILIDARKIADFGIGEYIKQLLIHYNKMATDDEYIIITNKGAEFPLHLNRNFRLVPVRIGLYSAVEFLMMGLIINGMDADIVHFPHFTVPLFVKAPVVTTIHDLIHLKYINTMFSHFHKFYLLPILKYAVIRSDSLIAVSRTARNEIIRHYGLQEKKIDIIYNGLNGFEPPSEKIQDTLGIKNPYFLYVGNLKFHKNLINLIRGFSAFLKESGKQADLVLAGIEKSKNKSAFINYVSKYIDPDRIITTGYLSSGELSSLYSNAMGLCLVSLCEGFGLPALEAAGFSIPVIASENSPMQEFLQKSGIYVNPYSISEIKDAMLYVFRNKDRLTKELKSKKLGSFRWCISAEKTYAVYRELYERRKKQICSSA